jgi:hypothetical protein
MQAPSMRDYVRTYFTLFERFEQDQQNTALHRGHPFDYEMKTLIFFFTLMQVRRIEGFKTQWRWLIQHPEVVIWLGFETVPVRTTLSRRYKTLYPPLQAFIAYLGQWAEILSTEFDSHVLIEDASLFKAHGPVWHQSDRQAQRVPEKLRNLDQEATWGKSGYHGWVYGYSLHLSCNRAGFPKLAQVETASLDESIVFEQKKEALFQFDPEAIVGDNGYFQAMRVRRWATEGVLLLSPAAAWKNGKYAQAYHRFLKQEPFCNWLKCRKTAIEPIFDLLSKLLGTLNNHKQLPLQRLANVQPFLCLGVLALQITMILNSAFGLPIRQISSFLSALN